MNTRVQDLMVPSVTTITPGETVRRAREIMSSQRISSLPVIDPQGILIGIVTATDLIDDPPDDTPVERLMSRKVYVVSGYDDASVAARVMRNHRIHHVVVTHEKKIAGIVSSFDLLRLVEDRRFTAKNAPTPKRTRRRTGGHRETDMSGPP